MPDFDLTSVRNREDLIRVFDSQSSGALFEAESSVAGRGLVKSYLLETTSAVSDGSEALQHVFARTGFALRSIDEKLASISDPQTKQVLGFVEILMDRHLSIYTIRHAQEADPWIRNLVADSPHLDRLWLSGQLFEALWKDIEKTSNRNRFVKLTFEHESIFEIDGNKTAEESVEEFPEEEQLEPIAEHRGSKFTVVDQISFLRDNLPQLQQVYAPLYAISQLRIPSGVGPGGHDFYHDGKVTNRSRSFRDHRMKLIEVLGFYRSFTERIEGAVWTHFEESTLDRSRTKIAGSPVIMKFSNELDIRTFQHWITSTFNRSRNKFRLWGHPIPMGDRKVHVYGLDRHLWQPVHLEIATTHMIALLPRGTCGNTVHRLVTNVQRYVDPAVVVTVAGMRYLDFAREEKTAATLSN